MLQPQHGIDRLRASRAGIPLFVALVTIATYLPSLPGEFVWDDESNIVNAAALRSLDGLARIWIEPGATMQYYPLTHTTFWLEFHLWGLKPFPYHMLNVALHATAAALAYLILRRLRVRGALLGALIFGVHPLQAESVAWIIERKNCLAGVLSAACCLAYMRYAGIGEDDPAVANGAQSPTGPAPGGPASRRAKVLLYLLSLFLFALALASKTAVVGLPLALLAIVAWKQGFEGIRRQLTLLMPFALLSIVAGRITAWIEVHDLSAEGVEFSWSFAQRVLIAGRAIWFYLGHFIFPADLMFIYPTWDIDPARLLNWVYPAAAFALGVAIIAAVRRGRAPSGLLAAAVVYIAMIAPALGFVNVYYMRFSFVQDHFQYFAALPAAAVVGAGLAWIAERARSLREAPRRRAAAGGALVFALSILSARECFAFRSMETLFTKAIEKNPDAWMAHYNLAHYLQSKGRNAEAVGHYRAVLRIRPGDVGSLTNLGAALIGLSRLDEGLSVFEEALQRDPSSADAHFNVGLAYDLKGRPAACVEHLSRAVELRPDWVRAQRVLAWILATDPDASIRNGARAVTLSTEACAKTKKGIARCLDGQAAAFAEVGRFEDAIATAQRGQALAVEAGEAQVARGIEIRLALYKQNKPYRRKPGILPLD